MYKIVTKKSLNPTVTLMEIEAPLVAAKAKPGQFIILRVDEEGERIPLTVAGYDRERGTVKIIFQIVGATTEKLNALSQRYLDQDELERSVALNQNLEQQRAYWLNVKVNLTKQLADNRAYLRSIRIK